MNDEIMVTVCGKCLRASCWQGELFCDEYMWAGTVEKSLEELRTLDLEHESWWRVEATRE